MAGAGSGRGDRARFRQAGGRRRPGRLLGGLPLARHPRPHRGLRKAAALLERMTLRLFVAIIMAAMPWVVHGQTFPSKPVRLIVTYPAGGSADTLARFLGQQLSETWLQQLVVDNRPGANGIVGTEAAAKAPPDGYTLYLATDGPISINLSLYAGLPYDWKRDFAPVTLLAVLNQVLVVPASLPAQNVQELIARAKTNPRKLNNSSIGIGNSPHL